MVYHVSLRSYVSSFKKWNADSQSGIRLIYTKSTKFYKKNPWDHYFKESKQTKMVPLDESAGYLVANAIS